MTNRESDAERGWEGEKCESKRHHACRIRGFFNQLTASKASRNSYIQSAVNPTFRTVQLNSDWLKTVRQCVSAGLRGKYGDRGESVHYCAKRVIACRLQSFIKWILDSINIALLYCLS